MGPVLKKLISKIPAMVTAGKTVDPALVALSDAAVAAVANGTVVVDDGAAQAAAAAQAIVDAYMALTANNLKAIATQRGLPVTNSATKTELTTDIVADGGDGTISAAEQSAIDAYTGYLAMDTAALEADAAGRDPAVVFGVDDDTDEEKARALLVADAI